MQKSKSKKSDNAIADSTVLSSVDHSTLFDLIYPTFAGFDPITTWPCSKEEDVTVTYVNGHGGLMAGFPSPTVMLIQTS